MRNRPFTLLLAALALAALAGGAPLAGAQPSPTDASARLRAVLPPEVAERVLATIADARSRQLPADALAQRALKFAAKGVPPDRIAGAIDDQARRPGGRAAGPCARRPSGAPGRRWRRRCDRGEPPSRRT